MDFDCDFDFRFHSDRSSLTGTQYVELLPGDILARIGWRVAASFMSTRLGFLRVSLKSTYRITITSHTLRSFGRNGSRSSMILRLWFRLSANLKARSNCHTAARLIYEERSNESSLLTGALLRL
jgi:hypothetical protein